MTKANGGGWGRSTPSPLKQKTYDPVMTKNGGLGMSTPSTTNKVNGYNSKGIISGGNGPNSANPFSPQQIRAIKQSPKGSLPSFLQKK